jgi:hypothetical protein
MVHGRDCNNLVKIRQSPILKLIEVNVIEKFSIFYPPDYEVFLRLNIYHITRLRICKYLYLKEYKYLLLRISLLFPT